jgi:hypothetical protein
MARGIWVVRLGYASRILAIQTEMKMRRYSAGVDGRPVMMTALKYFDLRALRGRVDLRVRIL